MKSVNYIRTHRVGSLDMFYRTQLTTERNEYNLSNMFVEPEIKTFEKPPAT